MSEAFSECVDPERFVIDAVKEFVGMKKGKKVGLVDTRWACSMVVRSMFPPEELKVGGRVFAKKVVERAEEVLREWKLVADSEGSEGTGMVPGEAAMFEEVLLGFGLKERFDEEFYGRLMVEFCSRRDMAKLAVPLFGDTIADFIDELLMKGKAVEAVYFESESGLTERFQAVPLLKSFLQKTQKECAEILKKGNNSSSATDKAHSLESTSTKSLIKCVQDHNLEAHFPIETLKKRLIILEKARFGKKKGPTRSHNKRANASCDQTQPGGPSSPGPSKFQRISSPDPTYDVIDKISPSRLSPVSKYLGPLAYPCQTTYDIGLGSSAYDYSGGSHVLELALESEIVTSDEARVTRTYATRVPYSSYDYGGVTYSPPSYP